MASRFRSELGVRGTMRLPNRKEELAHDKCTSAQVRRYAEAMADGKRLAYVVSDEETIAKTLAPIS
jgi:hypothetical protein